MSIRKKAKAKTRAAKKSPAKSRATGHAAKEKKGKDIVQVRKNIDSLVVDSAELIAAGVITVAKTGQLATAKYLFEAVGLYPATEETAPTQVVGSLAHTLLTRMGLPTDPVVRDEDEPPVAITRVLKEAAREAACQADEDPENDREEKQEPNVETGEGEPGGKGDAVE